MGLGIRSLFSISAAAAALGVGSAGPVACSSDTVVSGDRSITRVIGSEGGSIALGEVILDVPSGAMASPAAISVTRSDEGPVDGYVASTSVYRFEPDGLTFVQAAHV